MRQLESKKIAAGVHQAALDRLNNADVLLSKTVDDLFYVQGTIAQYLKVRRCYLELHEALRSLATVDPNALDLTEEGKRKLSLIQGTRPA